MTDLNHLVLIGRLTRDLGSDPNGRDFGYTQNGTAWGKISIANNRSKKDQNGQWVEEVSYFTVTIWGKTAENLKPYLLKGKQVCCECFIKQDRWEKDGQKFDRVSIVADNVQLLGGKNEGGEGFSPNTVYNNAQQARQDSQQYQQSQTSQFKPVNNQPQQQGFQEDLPYDDIEDIPF